MKQLRNLITIIFAIFLLAVLFTLIGPTPISAEGVCPEYSVAEGNTPQWGIRSGRPLTPAGLIVRTEEFDHAPINGINWTISTIDTDGGGPDRAGLSIFQVDASGWVDS